MKTYLVEGVGSGALTLKGEDGLVTTVDVEKTVHVKLDGVTGDLSALQPGDRVNLHYVEDKLSCVAAVRHSDKPATTDSTPSPEKAVDPDPLGPDVTPETSSPAVVAGESAEA